MESPGPGLIGSLAFNLELRCALGGKGPLTINRPRGKTPRAGAQIWNGTKGPAGGQRKLSSLRTAPRQFDMVNKRIGSTEPQTSIRQVKTQLRRPCFRQFKTRPAADRQHSDYQKGCNRRRTPRP